MYQSVSFSAVVKPRGSQIVRDATACVSVENKNQCSLFQLKVIQTSTVSAIQNLPLGKKKDLKIILLGDFVAGVMTAKSKTLKTSGIAKNKKTKKNLTNLFNICNCQTAAWQTDKKG